MAKVVVGATSLPAGRNMSSQIEYINRMQTYGADLYHLDVMDGEFVKMKTIDYTYFDQLREKSTLLFDAHLMCVHPEKLIEKYAKAGANILTVHYESFTNNDDIIKCLKRIRKRKMMAGLSIDEPTNITVIDPLMKYLDMVMIMCVKSGKGGQEFKKSALDKIKYVRQMNADILIEVDGGINDKTAPQCIKAGADILVSGSYIYNNDAYDAIHILKGKNGQ